MKVIKENIEELANSISDAKAGDIATMAELLYKLESITKLADKENFPNISAASEAIGEILKKIIMDAVSDISQSFKTVTDSIVGLKENIAEEDLKSFDIFPDELNLPSIETLSPSAKTSDPAAGFIDDSIIAEFLDQHSSSIREMESKILLLEKGPNPEAMAEIKRIMHTMKGEAGFLNLSDIEMVTHGTENYIESRSYPYDIELLLDVNDWMGAALADLTAGRNISRKADEILPRIKLYTEKPQEEQAPPPLQTQESVQTGKTASAEIETPVKEAGQKDGIGAKSTVEKDFSELIPEDGVWKLTGDISLLADFISESKEHMDNANSELLNLESDPSNQEALNSVFRAFHTIKGIASFLELKEILILAHNAENLLDLIRKGTLKISDELIDIAFEAMDMLEGLINKVKKGLETDNTMQPEAGLPELLTSIRAAARGETIKRLPVVPTDSKLGDILVESGTVSAGDIKDILVEETKQPTGKKLGEILVNTKKVAAKDVANALRRQTGEKKAPARAVEMRETIRVDYERLENLVDTVGELVVAEAMITQDDDILKIKTEMVAKKLHNLKIISRKLQEMGTSIRMVPILGTFQKMARLVRDLSKKSGKKIAFRTTGDETELDRAYVDKIGDPLVHMIRNSVDHGIENTQERLQTGKSEQAEIKLMAYHEGGNIIVEIRDDGRGIDKEAVRDKAIERGLIKEGDNLTDQELFQLLFSPGFSTAKKVTEVSGRGVGMDVVKRNISDLRGQIVIHSEPGLGSIFKLILPLTLALIDGMVVRVGDERYIFPVLSVIESFKAQADTIHTMLGSGEMISIRGRHIPFFRLGSIFNIEKATSNINDGLIVVVENDGKQIGLLVDDLIGLQQTVIKNLGAAIGQTEGVAGGAIMADGQVGLILDIPGLFGAVGKSELNISEESVAKDTEISSKSA